MTDETKLPLTSSDVTAEVLAQLREIAPQVFTEGGVDFDKLKATLGENVVPKDERYGLSWAGKSEAFRNVQIPSVGTLLPQPEESVNFDTTENLIIEGDNLEVLKLLQKSYHGKVKMIYIDPPYNTGNEFIYPDNYHEGLDDYLKYSGQVNDEGQAQTSNTETSGRFHSKWLNMMFPRLFVARNLLSDEGVIFVSIDDNEVHNLRMLMNEVFGEENFISCVIWQHSLQPKGYLGKFSVHHNYVLCYRRSESYEVGALERTDEDNKNYSNPDNDPKGLWRTGDVRNALYRPNLIYDIVTPSGKIISPPEKGWRWSKQTVAEKIKSGEIIFNKDETRIIRKIYLSTVEGRTPETIWFGKDVGTTRDAASELKELFDGSAPFDTPKPVQLIQKMLEVAGVKESDIVIDFFAGSGTTAHSVLEQNNKDGGNRKFILVQLPERIESPKYSTIADITKERVRRVIAKLNKELPLSEQDRGFKAFQLTSSNFKIWNADTTSTDAVDIGEQLRLYADNVERERTQQDILFELVLKSGLPLSAKVEQIEVAGKPVYSIASGQLLICLEQEISQTVLRGMIALTPIQMVCLDRAFGGNDQMKTNTVLEAKSQDVTFRTV